MTKAIENIEPVVYDVDVARFATKFGPRIKKGLNAITTQRQKGTKAMSEKQLEVLTVGVEVACWTANNPNSEEAAQTHLKQFIDACVDADVFGKARRKGDGESDGGQRFGAMVRSIVWGKNGKPGMIVRNPDEDGDGLACPKLTIEKMVAAKVANKDALKKYYAKEKTPEEAAASKLEAFNKAGLSGLGFWITAIRRPQRQRSRAPLQTSKRPCDWRTT